MSFRARLLLLVLVATVPLAILSSVRYAADRDEAISAAELQLDRAADAVAEQLTSAITGAQLLLFGLANPVAPEILAGGDVCTAFFAQVREQSHLYANVALVAVNGDNVCDALGTPFGQIPLNVANLPLFQRALRSPGRAVAEARLSSLTRTAVITVVYPVPGDDPQSVRMILFANLDLGVAAQAGSGADVGEHQMLIVRDDGEVLLWHPSGRADLARSPVAGTALLIRAKDQTANRITKVDGESYVWTRGATVAAMGEFSPRILIGVREASLTAAANHRFAQDLVVLTAVAVLLMLIAMLLAEGAIRQLLRIHAAIRRVVAGDLTTRVASAYPRGELGDLMARLDRTIAQFAGIIESSPAALVCTDRTGRINLWNEVAAEFSGFAATDVLGTQVEQLPGAYGNLLRRAVRQAVNSEGPDQFDATVPVTESDSRTLAVRSAPLHRATGEPVGALILITDVTEHRSLQAQLFQSQKLEALGQLTGGIAHDFNNLLTAIIGNSSLLMDRITADPFGHEIAESTLMAARHGADLTKSLLAFAKRQALAPRAVDVCDLVRGMEGLLQRTLGGHIACIQQFAPGAHFATVDPAKLESTILNLAMNARDAMPDGGTLTISVDSTGTGAGAREHDAVTISIADDGTGMAPDTLARVFEPFFTTKTHGTGLGMAMVYGFAKQSGGDIRIDSRLALGTTVHLSLPAAAPGSDLLAAKASVAIGGQGEVVLVVEDDPRVRRYALAQFAALGYEPIGASSAADALDILKRQQRVDLVFTDLMMPGGMSGDQLVDKISAVRPNLPVLFASGSPDAAAALMRRRGADVTFLAKPYERTDLARAVRSLLAA